MLNSFGAQRGVSLRLRRESKEVSPRMRFELALNTRRSSEASPSWRPIMSRKRIIRSVLLVGVALTVIAIPTLGSFANPAATTSFHNFTTEAETKIHALIDRWRGESTPAGIAKTNGRIEATQIDVSAKYPGRLEEVTVKEGDEVTAGQVLARISSPEYEAQLRGAQSEVLKAKQALAEADAQIARSKSDVTLAGARS